MVDGRTIRVALGLFVMSLAVCLIVYVALATPGSWFPSTATKSWSAEAMSLTRGRGEVQSGKLVVAPNDPSNTIVVALPTSFRSSEYPVVRWRAQHVPESAQVRLMWRNDYAPTRLNTAPVTIASGHLLPVTLAREGNWSGTITGLALAIQAPVAQPVLVESVAAEPMGALAILRERVSEWLTFEGWSQASINTITGGADVQALPLTVLVLIAAVLAGLAWLALAFRVRVFATLPIAIGTLFIAAWLISDARWTWDLARQVRATIAQYGGKDQHARHLAADDGALFAFIEAIRKRLPEKPVRIFMAADNPYLCGRGAYHLYPHNVYFDPLVNDLPPPKFLHAGDYVVVYQRRGVQFDAANGRLRWENYPPVTAELLMVQSGGALFKVL